MSEIRIARVLRKFDLDDGSGDDYPIFWVDEFVPVVENGCNGYPMVFCNGEWYDVLFEDGDLAEYLEILPNPLITKKKRRAVYAES